MKEAFKAWDTDASGAIERNELQRVLKALNPNWAERDLNELMRSIDRNGNGVIEYEEFCDWVMQGEDAKLGEGSFEQLVTELMREAGRATQLSKMSIVEVQVRPDGLYFILDSGEERLESRAVTSEVLELALYDPEEFIVRVECTEAGLNVTMNTGRFLLVGGRGEAFGPWQAPEGFHIVGLRTKPVGEGLDNGDRIVGADFAPLPFAASYDAGAALRFAAEREYLQTLRELLAKAAVQVDGFGPGGITALMLAAQFGSVGAVRLLLSSVADPNLTDGEGWTALTYASRCGSASAVEVLLSKGATTDGDGGAALREALRHQHNSAARALLRAGFGSAPPGTFTLEAPADAPFCSLPRPSVSPEGGTFAGSVAVILKTGGEVVEATTQEGVHLLFTMDGRDPFLVGRRYRGPIMITAPRTLLRVVSVGVNGLRSEVANAVFRVCHYILPDEVVSGCLKIRTFPASETLVHKALASAIGLACESIQVRTGAPDSTGPASPSSGLCWLQLPLRDPRPRHRLHIHRTFMTVNGARKRQLFIDKVSADVNRAVGQLPADVVITAGTSSAGPRTPPTGGAGAIIMDFTLPREQATELARQLSDPGSYLLTKAKARDVFHDSVLDVMEPLGDRLCSSDLHTRLQTELSKRLTIQDIIGIGQGDSGVVAVLLPRAEAPKLRKNIERIVRGILPDAEQGEISQSPDELLAEYMVDVVGHARTGGADGTPRDGGSVVRELNAENFASRVGDELERLHLPVRTGVRTRASSRKLSKLELRVEWSFKSAGGSGAYLDAICMAYVESHLAQLVDFRSAVTQQSIHDGEDTSAERKLGRAIGCAVVHTGDVQSAHGGQQGLDLDLAALPPEVTDLYFVVAAFGVPDLSAFSEAKVEVVDEAGDRQLTEYRVGAAKGATAFVVCCLSRPDGKWLMTGLGTPTAGGVEDYEPIRQVLAERQLGYQHWERRKELVKLRVLHKRDRLSPSSFGDFAQLVQHVLEVPGPIFQHLITFF